MKPSGWELTLTANVEREFDTVMTFNIPLSLDLALLEYSRQTDARCEPDAAS